MTGTSRINTQGDDASVVYSLPESQVPIVASDATEIDLIGVTANVAGDIYIKLRNDTVFFKNTVVAGQTIIGRIIGIGASTTIADANLIGLK